MRTKRLHPGMRVRATQSGWWVLFASTLQFCQREGDDSLSATALLFEVAEPVRPVDGWRRRASFRRRRFRRYWRRDKHNSQTPSPPSELHGWAEHTAGNGPPGVYVAGATLGIKGRAWFVIGELFELAGGLVVIAEYSGAWSPGNSGQDACP